MFQFIFRDEGDSGGGTGTAGDSSSSNAAASDAPAGNSPEGGTGGNSGGEQKDGKPPEITIESVTQDRDRLATKLGKQSNELSLKTKESDVLKELHLGLKENPELTLSRMAKKAGVKLTFGDPGVDEINKALASDDEADRIQLLSDRKASKDAEGIENNLMAKIRPEIDMLHDQRMQDKYPDYGDLKIDRDHIDLMDQAGKITRSELLHFAARGFNIEAAVKEAGVEAVKAYQLSLDKKHGGQIDTSGDRLADAQDTDFGSVSIMLNDLM